MMRKKAASPRRGSTAPPEITVLAGVNGAGKSSVGGAELRAAGAEYFNPDELARRLRDQNGLPQQQANAEAWAYGKSRLEAAIAAGKDFTFESTLGGQTITDILVQAAAKGYRLHVWFVGLESVELHIERVAARVSKGGHPISDADIRRRWIGSRRNLIRLLPHVHELRVFDNSVEAPPQKTPEPKLVLSVQEGELVFPGPAELAATPAWAKPIAAAAYKLWGLIK